MFELKFISINTFSTELLHLYPLKSFEGICSLTNIIIPPPELFLSSRNGDLKPSIANWLEGNEGSTFVSEISKMSNLSWTISRSISNLFLKEYIFRWPIINLSVLFNLTWSRTFRSLLESLLLADWLLLCSLPLVFSLSHSVVLWETFSYLLGL